MSNIILFHGDLDGLMSALLFYNSSYDEIEIDEVKSIDYGHDYSLIYDQYDNFFVFDFGENPGRDKTTLWVDHHIENSSGEEFKGLKVISESLSCTSLVVNSGVAKKGIISPEDIEMIDMVDSAQFPWSDNFSFEDFLFPDPKKGRLSQFILLNQLLRKNRKFGIAEKLFATNELDVTRLLSHIERDGGAKTVKYKAMIDARRNLMDKMVKNTDTYIKYFDGIPILFTKEFSTKDWQGYDLNLLGYLANTSPYMIVVFDFGHNVNIQITRNIFCNKNNESVYKIIKQELEDPRGHEGIINMSFENSKQAIEKLCKITELLSKHI